MWSLYDFIWEDALKGFLREIKLFDGDFQAGRMFFGRPYWNLGAVKRCLMKLPGFVEREFDNDLSVQITYEGDGIRTPLTLGGVARALPTILAIESVWKRQERFDRAFLAGRIRRAGETVRGNAGEAGGLPRRADSRRVSNHRIELFPNDLLRFARQTRLQGFVSRR
jgi:hypothetical protein